MAARNAVMVILLQKYTGMKWGQESPAISKQKTDVVSMPVAQLILVRDLNAYGR
jgi:hypothetical protein